MKAILFAENGGPENLSIAEVADPTIQPNEVLVAVVATSVNRADLLQLAGKYPGYGTPGEILGLDLAGTVIEVGAEVEGLAVGDNVCALVDGGGYGQLAAVPASMCLKLPSGMSFTKAAAVPEVFVTAFQALYWLGDLEEGDDILIHAGASGVGTAMIQLAKFSGARVFVTASANKHQRLYELGADVCIDYRKEDFADVILEKTDGQGVHLIIDFVGPTYAKQNFRCAATDGCVVLLSLLGGAAEEQVDLAQVLLRRLTLVGSTLRNRSADYKAQLLADFRDQVWPLFADRSLRAIVDTIYDWEDADDALKYMQSNANVGKIVICIGE
ncbi:NAD(P)H-quinone oxidoreductase [Lewinella sp. 4G2]|uniref:NAD(P)H-quinone oxidoreductase n=1 Tax=Lewinella sp. 4G2 TaxID=1803372 RepID=UPI0007B45E6A|nr:NAD(P)H-quinone oxidoreductase [Lewinella sp. 4G2]OAV45466.1 NADPH:quinone oxidoreductase [Lewinella sp. 4G2]